MKYSLLIGAHNYTLQLERNKWENLVNFNYYFCPQYNIIINTKFVYCRDLVGKNFTLTHYSKEGTQVTTNPDLMVCWFASCLYNLFSYNQFEKKIFLHVNIWILKITSHHVVTYSLCATMSYTSSIYLYQLQKSKMWVVIQPQSRLKYTTILMTDDVLRLDLVEV